MLEKKLLLRKSVREEMGLKDSDMLVMALSSINPAKGHLLLLESGIEETFGRVKIEAMAFGIPVLGTDAGGTKEIVEHNVT
ncbi:putative glycosyl transferase, family 1 [Helianthus debilis subsp. tardiflorus]